MENDKRTATETTVKDDPEARELLRRAFEKTSRWGRDFSGFESDLFLNDDGTEYQGRVRVRSPKEVDLELSLPPDQKELLDWAQDQIGMMAVHRASRSFEDSDGKSVLAFGEEDAHPLGRTVQIHGDGLNSRYRIKDDRIQQISRDMGRVRFTINVEEAMRTTDGKYLTTRYTVFYFSPDGGMKRAESYTDEPAVVSGLYLPGLRRVILAEKGRVMARVFEFKNHRLL